MVRATTNYAYRRTYQNVRRRRNRYRRRHRGLLARRPKVSLCNRGRVVPDVEHCVLTATFRDIVQIGVGSTVMSNSILVTNLNNWWSSTAGEYSVNGWDQIQLLYNNYYVKGCAATLYVLDVDSAQNMALEFVMAPVTATFTANDVGINSIIAQPGSRYEILTQNTSGQTTLGSIGKMSCYGSTRQMLGMTEEQVRQRCQANTNTTTAPDLNWYIQYGARVPSAVTSTGLYMRITAIVKFYVCLFNPISRLVGNVAS